MATISSLLNPMSEKRLHMPQTPTRSNTEMQPPISPRKKAKLTKDAAVFQHGPIRGECRFPPDEYQDELLATYHQQFEVNPFGEIADYPRHIPYNSEKKGFQEKTGRECLEVFQYTFRKPGDANLYTILWDYNIGLVRTTALFRCTGHSKTTPAKMLNKNPGLRDVCHSITGGALVAQGYWIPYAAAKAIAATFCYEIRYALTPVFGHDFPRLCTVPEAEGFGDMKIDPKIIQACKEEAQIFRDEEPKNTTSIISPALSSQTPSPSLRHIGRGRAQLAPSLRSPYDRPEVESYNSDTDSIVNDYTLAPSTPPVFRNPWTTINGFRTPPRSVPASDRILPSPRSIINDHSYRQNIRTDVPLTPPTTIRSRASSLELSPTTLPAKHLHAVRDVSVSDESVDIEKDDLDQRLRCAVILRCMTTGLSTAEVLQHLEHSNEVQTFGEPMDAAVTMISLKTGMPQREVITRLDLNDCQHRRSKSW